MWVLIYVVFSFFDGVLTQATTGSVQFQNQKACEVAAKHAKIYLPRINGTYVTTVCIKDR